MKYIIKLIFLSSFMYSTLFADGNVSSFEAGSAIYRSLKWSIISLVSADHWHSGMFMWFSYQNGTAKLRGLHVPSDGDPVDFYGTVSLDTDPSVISDLRYNFRNVFRDNETYHGAYSLDLTPSQISNVVATGVIIQGNDTGYTWNDMIETNVDPWTGQHTDIVNQRCDAIPEWCFEENGFLVSRGYDITFPTNFYLDTHNDFHNNAYNVGELCPKIQAGEVGNDSNLEYLISLC